MLTLKAAGLLDVDAGEILRPGILRIDGDRIAGVGGDTEGDLIDLGDQILLPGLMDMEVNLLLGNCAKAASKLGWSHNCTFRELIREMVFADLEYQRGLAEQHKRLYA